MFASDRIISLSETHTSPQESGNFSPAFPAPPPEIVALFSFLLRLLSNPLGEGGKNLGATLEKKVGSRSALFLGGSDLRLLKSSI